MPIFRVHPITALLEDPAWTNSPYRGECWVNAADEQEARGLVSGRYEDARANIPGHSEGLSPWMDPRLTAAEQHESPPDNMQIPNGVVVAGRQM